MTSRNWLRGTRNGLGVGLTAVGMILSSAAIAPADPAASPTPSPVTQSTAAQLRAAAAWSAALTGCSAASRWYAQCRGANSARR